MLGTKFIWTTLIFALALVISATWMRFWPHADIGKRLAENNCGVCHDLTSEKKHEKGPFLWGVYNRPAGSVGFNYSDGFVKLVNLKPFAWDEAHLEKFISDPKDFIPLTKMAQRDSRHPLAFEGMESKENRRDVIAYLKTLK